MGRMKGFLTVAIAALLSSVASAQQSADTFTDRDDCARVHVSGFVCPARIGFFERDAVGEYEPAHNEDFCAYGARDAQIIFREVLPNALTAVVVAASLQVPSAILLEASLSFIGAGDPSVMSWGRMLNNAQQYMRQAWWVATFPGLAISLTAMGLALMADGINDFLNPRLRQND